MSDWTRSTLASSHVVQCTMMVNNLSVRESSSSMRLNRVFQPLQFTDSLRVEFKILSTREVQGGRDCVTVHTRDRAELLLLLELKGKFFFASNFHSSHLFRVHNRRRETSSCAGAKVLQLFALQRVEIMLIFSSKSSLSRCTYTHRAWTCVPGAAEPAQFELNFVVSYSWGWVGGRWT